jgi:CheY-like chemotaxis protein
MDIQLPGINGIEALQRLRADPVTSATPVIAVTASVMTRDRTQDECRLSPVREAHAFFTSLGLDGLVSLDLEYVPHQLQALGIVFHD